MRSPKSKKYDSKTPQILSSNTVAPEHQSHPCKSKTIGTPVIYIKVVGALRRPHDTTLARVAAKTREEIVANIVGQNIFVIVAREMAPGRNYFSKFLRTDGGYIARDFEAEQKSRIKKALKAKTENL